VIPIHAFGGVRILPLGSAGRSLSRMPSPFFKGPTYWLLPESPLSSTERLVLVALCSFADGTRVCYPAVVSIAQRSALSERAVQRALRGLSAAGAITVKIRSVKGGPKVNNLYTLLDPSGGLTGDSVTPITARRVTKPTPTGAKTWPKRVPQSHPITCTTTTTANTGFSLEPQTDQDGTVWLGNTPYRDRSARG
jgi:hypothetical protein